MSIYRSREGERAVMALYDQALAAWPVPYETKQLKTRYDEAFVIAGGQRSAPALLLLHGAGANSMVWAGEFPHYAAHYRVYAVDLPGEPGRSAPIRPPWQGPAFAEWLEDVLDGLEVERAALVGTSQGGWTALKFAVHRPERVSGLALLAPAGVVPDRASFLPKAILLQSLGAWGRRRLMQLLFAGRPLPAGAVEVMEVVMRHFKPRVGVLPLFTDDELGRLAMPVLVVGGGQDIARDMEKIAGRLQRLAPDVTVKILPEAGHALVGMAGEVLSFFSDRVGIAEGAL